MAEGTFTVRVFSGRGLEIESTARAVNVPSAVGQLGFLPNHCEYVGLLSTGVVELSEAATDTVRTFVVSGGLCTFSENVLTLLADGVDQAASVDRANYAKERDVLESKKASLSMLDPEWEIVSQRLARIQAIDALIGGA
jgi:F-type H+-transporting ATPase subunit epsilon